MEEKIRIYWWGHACIEIVYKSKRLMVDPHDGVSIGVNIPKPPTAPDYLLVTHEHYDHNAVEVVASQHTRLLREAEGVHDLDVFRVRGVRLPHDEFEGRIRGHVVAYVIECGGVKMAHMSDLGRPLRDEEAREIGSIDVAFIPAGGVYTLHPRQALEVALTLGSRLVIPIHYWYPGIHLPLNPIDELLRYAKKWRVVRLDTNMVEISRDELPDDPTILVLAPPHS